MNENIKKRLPINRNTVLFGILALIILAQACVIGYMLRPVDVEWFDAPRPPLGDFINIMDKGAKGDGVADDSKAVTLALNEAQEKGMDVYFPAGTYNLNNTNFTAKKNIRIFGDGDSTVLYLPGSLYCYNDITLENLSVFKRNGVFVYLKPEGYSNVTVDRVKVYNDLDVAENCRVVYAFINTVGANRGVDNVTFTNNNISKCQTGLQLKCEVKSGLIDSNILTDFGDPNKYMNIDGLTVGTVDPDNNWVPATNVVISNNTIKGVYSPYPEDSATSVLVYSILATGSNIDIINNYIENQNIYTGIYAKANDLLISGNTLINAGSKSSICVKVTAEQSNGLPIIIENNDITSSVDTQGSIRVHCTNFIINGNKIKQYDNNGMLADGSAIYHATSTITNAIVEGNDIYTESKYGILLMTIDGYASVKNNKITHNVVEPVIYSSSAAFSVRGASSSTVIDFEKNSITIQRGQYFTSGSSSNKDGSVINIIDNTMTSSESKYYLISMNYMTSNLIGNTIIVNQDPNFDSNVKRNGIITASATSVVSVIDNNDIYYYGINTDKLFSLSSQFDLTNNRITFGENSNVTSVVSYAPTADATPGLSTIITGNTIGNVTDILNGGSIANADCFILFNTSSSYLYPETDISQNSVVLNTNMLNTTSASKPILSEKGITVDYNIIYSALNSGTGADNAAVIASPQKQDNLSIGNKNISFSEYVENQVSEAEKAAAEKAAADRLAAEQAEAEAAAEAAAKEAAEKAEAERLAAEKAAAEKAEADRIAAELAQLEAEQTEAARVAEESEKAASEADSAAGTLKPSGTNDFIYYTEKSGFLILEFAYDIDCSSSWNKVVNIDGTAYKASKYGNNSICVEVKLSHLKKSFKVTVSNLLFPSVDKKKTYTITKTFTGGSK